MQFRSQMTTRLLLALATFLVAPLGAQELQTEEQKALYALGMAISRDLPNFGLTEAELAIVQAGVADSAMGRDPKVDMQAYFPKLQAMAQERAAKVAEKEKAKSASFLAEEAAKPGAVKKDSGLIITEITPGTGANPGPTDKVTVHYHGTFIDGNVFDSSVDRGTPATFGLNQVVKCWTEGVQLIKVGGKARLVCPSDIAYGDSGRGSIPGGATLIFEVELISIEGQ